MPQFYLAKHVHVALSFDNAIFLDLRSGQYLGLSADQTSALKYLVQGWPCGAERPAVDDTHVESGAFALVSSLERQGLLTQCLDEGRTAQPPALPRAKSALRDEVSARGAIRLHHIYSLGAACVRARLSLRNQKVGHALQRVRARRLRSARVGHADELRDLAAIFYYLRPWFYTRYDKCLFDSLVMVEFLAAYDYHPQWVIGVKTRPFGAHAWVQQGESVLNDSVESVGDFSPIVTA